MSGTFAVDSPLSRFRGVFGQSPPSHMSDAMKPAKARPEQCGEEQAIRRQHAATPARPDAARAISSQSFGAILALVGRLKAARESQGLTLAEVAGRMGIDAPALSRLESGKSPNPTLATLFKWAEAVGRKLEIDLPFA